MFEFRTDAVTLLPAKRMDDGRLVAEALITKPGVFEYPDSKYPGGVRRELRPDAEVYSRATMDSFANIPCTPRHPPELLTSKTAKAHMVGSTGDHVTREAVANDQDWLKTKVMIADASTIKRMDAGDNAVSCGYACVIDETPGIDPKYGRYDMVQREIRGNHLAVSIPLGRAGRMARVRMDAELTEEEIALRNNRGEHKMDEIEKLKETVKTLDAGLKASEAEALALKTRCDAAEAAAGEAKGALQVVEKERDALKSTIASGATAAETETIRALQARVDAAEQRVARFDDALDANADARADLMIKAGSVLGADVNLRGMSERQILAATVKRLDSAADVSDAVDINELRGQFKARMASRLVRARQDANVASILVSPVQQARQDTREQKLTEYREQWKKPLSQLIAKKGA